ncbi:MULTISPECIES: hypothetical protein [unclassified Mesorhizobium]|uniref:hypothetical protein n=1 Tax=unclassified Mesorhizobium TaxID=325217 RepID=UPI0003CE526E|nr:MULTISPECIES: hypothetical protein [unclassified Mesorhizobium]ESY49036.1 hypothetical protein X745_28065 [Mesorhizobium sp. LNJC374B00]ESY52726.1 hypothetical protein X744_28535 [Mesorhizobium sp. LNJC372A00]WJI81449.1 hypothetical protein NLY34_01425 [Mesorhizobium sp. C374B]WJI87968.1 hypothetical protein NLY42_03840 [Mesorhizobium sp. C372A]
MLNPVDKIIADIVAAMPGSVSIAQSIQQLRLVSATSSTDIELEMAIATAAAYQWKPILFDRMI